MNHKLMHNIWIWFIFILIMAGSITYLGITLNNAINTFNGDIEEDIASVFMSVFPSLIGGSSGMLFAGKFIHFTKHAKKLKATLPNPAKPLYKNNFGSEVKPSIVSNPDRVFKPIANIKKNHTLVDFPSGIVVYKVDDGYYINTKNFVYGNEKDKCEKFKYAVGELSEMIRHGQ